MDSQNARPFHVLKVMDIIQEQQSTHFRIQFALTMSTPSSSHWRSAMLYLLVVLPVVSAGSITNITVDGNSAFDNQINKILHWDGTRESLGIGPDVIAGIAIAAGLFLTFFGHKLIRPAMFLAGFAIGSIFGFIAAEKIFREKEYVETACWISFAVGGLIVGALVICLYKLGIFLVGAYAGLLLATQLQTSFGYAIYPSDPKIVLIVLMVVCGLVCGFVAVKLERPALIIATAWAGAVMCVWGIGFFAGHYPNTTNLKQHADAKGDWHVNVPNEWWGYLAGSVALALLGMFVQFRRRPAGQESAAAAAPRYVEVSTPAKGDPIRHA
ncbi:hypothetical protein DYB38_001199 [Aphanomyces astaci]|uniref:Transmembrane protein 198 n=2 Tax=Aphanomyces astaci TaxID=112090 RepID=A0A397CUB2_APHAT|nr:hypothetical protein DYB38_001199 [Aphanomyces astaci]